MMGLRKTESSATEIFEKYRADKQPAAASDGSSPAQAAKKQQSKKKVAQKPLRGDKLPQAHKRGAVINHVYRSRPEARFSREMAAARGPHGDPAQARRNSPDPGRRHDGRLHLAAIFLRRAGRRRAGSTATHTVQYSARI